jgi:hypothetical protein
MNLKEIQVKLRILMKSKALNVSSHNLIVILKKIKRKGKLKLILKTVILKQHPHQILQDLAHLLMKFQHSSAHNLIIP